MTGLELQQEISGTNAPPMIFLTGRGDIPSSAKAMKAGASEFLLKPIDEADLLRVLEAALEQDRLDLAKPTELEEFRKRYASLSPRQREVLPFVVFRTTKQAHSRRAWEKQNRHSRTSGPDLKKMAAAITRRSRKDDNETRYRIKGSDDHTAVTVSPDRSRMARIYMLCEPSGTLDIRRLFEEVRDLFTRVVGIVNRYVCRLLRTFGYSFAAVVDSASSKLKGLIGSISSPDGKKL